MADKPSPLLKIVNRRPRPKPTVPASHGTGRGYNNPNRIARFSGRKNNRPPTPRETQLRLKKLGYNIKLDGVYGPETKAAVNAEANGIGPVKFNTRGRRRPQRPAAARPAPARGGGGGGGGGGGPIASPADQQDFGGVPEVDVGGTGTARMLPRSMADTLAGYEFDPQIQELLTQRNQGGRDLAQHQQDIGGWYGQVRGAQETAGVRDAEAGTRARTDVSNALQGILQSLGGSRGAGMVGAAGLSDLTSLAAQGASQDRYNADMAPLLASEEAGAHSRETAMASQRKAALDSALVKTRGQRGQGVAKSLMGIIQANNQGRQTNFQNRLAVQNARLAGASLGLNADQTYAGIEAQRASTKLNQQKLKLETLAAQQKSGKANWATLNYPDRRTVVQDSVTRALGELNPTKGGWDAEHVYNSALAYMRTGGYTSARPHGYKGKVNSSNRAQINAAVNRAIAAAKRAWEAKYKEAE